MGEYEGTDKLKLIKTAQDLFYMMYEFGRVHNKKIVDIFMVDDCLQDLSSDTCGIFQLYFYINVFLPKEDSKIVDNTKLTMKTTSTLLNETFVLDINENKRLVESFAKELNIKRN